MKQIQTGHILRDKRTLATASWKFLLLAALEGCATCALADDLVTKLQAVPALSIVSEDPAPPGFRFFVLSYQQQVDHLMPWKGTFAQRVTLLHRALGAPTIVNTAGYNISLTPSRSEPTQIVDGNELAIEHRFFLPSRPAQPDWRDLTIYQAATDHHRIIEALKPVYTGQWLATGRSKGGMASVFHRRFYPGDVVGTIAYVAANDAINRVDRYAAFLEGVGTDPSCRQRLTDLQHQALQRRGEIVNMMKTAATAAGWTYQILGSPERALEFMVIDGPFAFWQNFGRPFCGLIPYSRASTAEIYAALDAVLGFASYTDQGIWPVMPAYYQATTQLGWPKLPEGHLAGLLQFPGEDMPASFVSAGIALPHFDDPAMLDIDLFVRLSGNQMMFVYGENDPWTAEAFVPGPRLRDSYVYLVPGASHGARIAQLPTEQRDAAGEVLRRWAGRTSGSFFDISSLPDTAELDQFYVLESLKPRLRR